MMVNTTVDGKARIMVRKGEDNRVRRSGEKTFLYFSLLKEGFYVNGIIVIPKVSTSEWVAACLLRREFGVEKKYYDGAVG